MRRWTVLAAAVCASVLALAAPACFGQGAPAAGGLIGAVYTPPVPAADFTLVDQHGTPFHMADMEGKVVVFSFLYTHCQDVCPFIALKLKAARELLGEKARRVGFVAVTTDPQRDTVPVIAAYSRELGMFDIWHFVTGPLPQVRAVWARYLANATAAATASGNRGDASEGGPEVHDQGLAAADTQIARGVISRFGGGYEVEHFAAFHIIDQRGRIRVTLDQDALPQEIASNVSFLLDGK